jgi:hypothetical protein
MLTVIMLGVVPLEVAHLKSLQHWPLVAPASSTDKNCGCLSQMFAVKTFLFSIEFGFQKGLRHTVII